MRKNVIEMIHALDICEVCKELKYIEQQFEPCGHKCVCNDCEMPPSCPICTMVQKDTLEGAETGRNLLEPVII